MYTSTCRFNIYLLIHLKVLAVANMFPGLAGAAIGAASRTTSSQLQTKLLDESKTLAESALQLMYAAKEAGGNAKSTAAHQKVTETSQMMVAAADDLTDLLEKAGAEAGLITGKEKCKMLQYSVLLLQYIFTNRKKYMYHLNVKCD